MDKTKIAGELVRMAKTLTAIHSPEAQDVVQALKPVRRAIVDLRNYKRKAGEGRAADDLYLDLIGMVNDLEEEVKRY